MRFSPLLNLPPPCADLNYRSNSSQMWQDGGSKHHLLRQKVMYVSASAMTGLSTYIITTPLSAKSAACVSLCDQPCKSCLDCKTSVYHSWKNVAITLPESGVHFPPTPMVTKQTNKNHGFMVLQSASGKNIAYNRDSPSFSMGVFYLLYLSIISIIYFLQTIHNHILVQSSSSSRVCVRVVHVASHLSHLIAFKFPNNLSNYAHPASPGSHQAVGEAIKGEEYSPNLSMCLCV